MIRIAHVMGKMVGGGVEQVVMNYYRGIDRNEIQFDFLVDSDSTVVPEDEIEKLGGSVIEIPPYQCIPQYSKALEELFDKDRWPIVHSHINTLSVLPLRVAEKRNIPIRIAHAHSTMGKGEVGRNVLKLLLRTQASRYPTHRWACSESAGKWMFGRNSDFEIVRNAVSLEDFAFNKSKRGIIRKELSIPEDSFVIGHVGRLVFSKNQSFLLRAFALALKDNPKMALVLVGDGPDRRRLLNNAIHLGIEDKTYLVGQRNNISDYYSAFDMFAFPSNYEGLGMACIEAQRSGLPCVVSDKVPADVDLLDFVKRLSIESRNESAWALSFLEESSHPRNRDITDSECFLDYDIRTASKSLGERYLILAGDILAAKE